MSLDSLPVELVADILGNVDLDSLVKVAYLSRRLYNIASDPSLNPWKGPILRALLWEEHSDSLRTLDVRMVVPKRNWDDILLLGTPNFLLYETTLPYLSDKEWQNCFQRRFLPGWRKWRKDGMRWREAFLR